MTAPILFELSEEQPDERVDKVLARLLDQVSRVTIQRWISEGRVRRDGVPLKAKDRVGGGEILAVQPGERPSSRAEPDSSVSFPVVFEDEHLIVVDKPAGMVVHPARGHATGTLVNGLLARPGFTRMSSDPRDPNAPLRPGIVHRIDKETSGLLVVAKTEVAREGLKSQLADHSVVRRYLAITVGLPRLLEIRTLHARHPKSRLRFTSQTDEGKVAVTHLSVAEVIGMGMAALVSCRLETGRTHQIRVHLSECAKTPILADTLYGGSVPMDFRVVASALGRHALHAAVLGFEHPVTGVHQRFESSIPPDMQRALSELRKLAEIAKGVRS